jgi:thymidylate synthase (FAD)
MFFPEVFHTDEGVAYLKEPGVVLLYPLNPQFNYDGVRTFLKGFDPKLGFDRYVDDPTRIPAAEQNVKFAGQLCYMSFGRNRTINDQAKQYFDHIKESGHGSVLEHVSFSFLIYGLSRSQTHELVRHRSGVAISQVSQRYVSGSCLRFVERPEFQSDPELHNDFLKRINRTYRTYHELGQKLLERQRSGSLLLSAEQKTGLRKKVNQAARACLTNETEAPIQMTFNARALRHVIEQRASGSAETETRRLGIRLFKTALPVISNLLSDYNIIILEDGTEAVFTKWRKV